MLKRDLSISRSVNKPNPSARTFWQVPRLFLTSVHDCSETFSSRLERTFAHVPLTDQEDFFATRCNYEGSTARRTEKLGPP